MVQQNQLCDLCKKVLVLSNSTTCETSHCCRNTVKKSLISLNYILTFIQAFTNHDNTSEKSTAFPSFNFHKAAQQQTADKVL